MRVKGTGMGQALSRSPLLLQGLVRDGNSGLLPMAPAFGLGRPTVPSVQMEKLSPEWGEGLCQGPIPQLLLDL